MRRTVICHPDDARQVVAVLGQWPGIRPRVETSRGVAVGTVVVLPLLDDDDSVLDVARLSADLDTAAGTVHVPVVGDGEDYRQLAGRLLRYAAVVEGVDTRTTVQPFPWS